MNGGQIQFLSNRGGDKAFTLPENGVTVANFYSNFLGSTFNPAALIVRRGQEVLSGTSLVYNGQVISEVPKKQDAAA